MSVCGTDTVFKAEDGRGVAKTIFCNTWDSDCCHERRLAQLKKLCDSGKPNLFLTLTMRHAKGRSPLKVCDRLLRSWSKFARWLKSHYGCDVQYLWWLEEHQSGFPHLHIAIRTLAELRTEELRKRWHRLTGAFEIKLEQITAHSSIGKYISDYLKDGPAKFGTHKRYHVSHGYAPKDLDEPSPFDQIPGKAETTYRPLTYFHDSWRDLPGFYFNRRSSYCHHGLDSS
jgi:hypothetical protein